MTIQIKWKNLSVPFSFDRYSKKDILAGLAITSFINRIIVGKGEVSNDKL
jgi:hypothetical protein